MGLIWNTAATAAMIARLAEEFSADATKSSTNPLTGAVYMPPIGKWRAIRNDFQNKTLSQIAIEQQIYGGAGAGTPEDGRWQNWLGDLPPGMANKLRSQIYDGLANKFDEIIIQVVPRGQGQAVKVEDAEETEYHPGLWAQVITVRTPTAHQVRLALRRKARARRAGKSAAKKKKA